MKILLRILIPLAILLLHKSNCKKVVRCLGTNSALSIAEDRMDHLKKMVTRYTNCTHVQGNLEITSLEDPAINVTFLKDIEVVTGYVLIAMNYVPYLPLEKLKVIRGQELYGPNKLALYVAVNFNRASPTLGLRELGFKNLTEIQRGNVSIIQNNLMCYADKINWMDIMNPSARRKRGWTVHIDNDLYDPASCKKCEETCESGYCWGEGPDKCQTLTSSLCHPNCGSARCRGSGPDDCCDSECAGGCNGPTDRDCVYCLHVNNDGVCQSNCPPQFIYDQLTQRYLPNPDYKYHYNDMCVDKCPSNMLVEENGCVKHCRKGRHNNGSGICVPCTGNECNRECFGVGNPDGPLYGDETVDAKNVHFFEGCNIVRGNVIFQAYAFIGDNHTETPPMTAEQVMKAFSGVKVINGYLKILSWPQEMEDFSVFANLTTIIGIDLFRGIVSFLIQDSITEHGPFHLSHVRSLGFRSLKTIKYGNVYIGFMKKLCYHDTINWTKIIKNPVDHKSFQSDGTLLRVNHADCSNETCDPSCSEDGCWGPGPHECLSCKRFFYNGECKLFCDKEDNIYQEGNECKPCDSQCTDTCDGPGPMNCTSCKAFRDGPVCVALCPDTKYPDPETKECVPCHDNCMNQAVNGGPLCSGPNSTLGPGGCEYCQTVVTDRNLDIRDCLPRNQTTCPEAHFLSKYGGLVKADRACVPCFKNCNNCTGSSEKDCLHTIPGKGDTAIVLSVVITIICLGLIGLILFICHRRSENTKKKRHMSMRALGLEAEPEPMTPSGVAPNQAQLRIVKETELTIGKILGSGAFGTVHKGYWIPDLAPREKVRVPVAIKVLRDQSSQFASNEILDEAFVMASCEHPNLVRLLGISLSHNIMLITQLMPLGNLLEYVRDNKDNIGSQNLLNWCLQIAKGMCYLAEEKHLVHRDLAARNVLVKSPNHVRITDFGLAKLLDVNEDVYRAEGGKMPIKWLALESIQHRLFTQKSDVWSFGVTVWELMTFGKKPYENVPAREVHTLLEKGDRLLQPTTCTIDVYMLMIKCWTVEAESRPTFRELVDEFSKMARDPQRYLVIPNDGRLPQLPSPTTSEFFRSLKFEEGDDFPILDAEEYLQPFTDIEQPRSHFPLQPAPITAQWRKQHEGQHLLNGRFGPYQSSSTADSRLDSAVTVMTSLPSESTYPNGCSTPFSVATPGPTMTPRQRREVTGFPAFGRSSDRMSRDHIPGPSGHVHYQPSRLGPRTQSESSDVFLSTPSFQRKDAPWETLPENSLAPEHPGMQRAREDSATMRYSAEPILVRQESTPNALRRQTTMVGGCEQDEDGYLAPTDSAKQKPEYLDPMAPSPSERRKYVQELIDAHSHQRSMTNSFSGMENPDYEPTFNPGDRSNEGFTSGLRNLIDARSTIPETDDDGYEVPMASPIHDPSPRARKLSTEYENIDANTGLPNIGEGAEEENGYLTSNHRMLPRRHGSQSEESTSSEKRDSGMQSEGDEEVPLKAKNVKATGGNGDGVNEPSNSTGEAQSAAPSQPGPSGPVHNMPNGIPPQFNNNHSVDNPSYELLENMTDGGFEPMSEFKPGDDVFDPHFPAFEVSKTNPFPLPDDELVFDPEMNSPGGSGRKNPLKLTINCDGNGCDESDDIFVTPETKRRSGNGVDFGENPYATPESRRRNEGKLTPDAEHLTGKVPRTYSEPDSGVGIEMAVDNILYHRLGSSGWDASD